LQTFIIARQKQHVAACCRLQSNYIAKRSTWRVWRPSSDQRIYRF